MVRNAIYNVDPRGNAAAVLNLVKIFPLT